MGVLEELTERTDVDDEMHVHRMSAIVIGQVIVQDVYVCIARSPTTYDLEVMRKFRDSFDGYETAADFAVCGSQLRFGEIIRTEHTVASISNLESYGVEVRGSSGMDRERQMSLASRYVIRLMPCRRLLGRHNDGNYRPPHWSGRHPVDQFIVKFVLH